MDIDFARSLAFLFGRWHWGMAMAASRQAVILIHGMGEQIPMDTIKGFVTTVWSSAGVAKTKGILSPDQTWSKPDDRTGSLELRRITTRESIRSATFPKGVRTDFYELYWADLTAGSTWQQFVAWVWYLLCRRPSRVPSDLFSAWIALWVASLLVLACASLSLIPEALWARLVVSWMPQKLVLGIAAAAGAALHMVATKTFGRVVRYTRADPDNIAARKAVRERGLALLRALHSDDSYARVVVVAHSLGTILAHDLVSYFWAEQVGARTVDQTGTAFVAVAEVERTGADLDAVAPGVDPKLQRDAYRVAQVRLWTELLARPNVLAKDRWLISDLVTLGCPLAHAEVLLANDGPDLARRIRERELPSSPPLREPLDPNVLAAAVAAGILPIATPPSATRLMTYPVGEGTGKWALHHAAPFAVVRWTNVFDPARMIYKGDIISGPVARNFGNGIEDIDLSKEDARSSGFTHTRYWDLAQPVARIKALRKAVDLLQ